MRIFSDDALDVCSSRNSNLTRNLCVCAAGVHFGGRLLLMKTTEAAEALTNALTPPMQQMIYYGNVHVFFFFFCFFWLLPHSAHTQTGFVFVLSGFLLSVKCHISMKSLQYSLRNLTFSIASSFTPVEALRLTAGSSSSALVPPTYYTCRSYKLAHFDCNSRSLMT
jgi:hypothetical protein